MGVKNSWWSKEESVETSLSKGDVVKDKGDVGKSFVLVCWATFLEENDKIRKELSCLIVNIKAKQ